MKTVRLIASVVALAPLFMPMESAWGDDEAPGGYLFFGLDVSAESGRSYFPIVGIDRKSIFVDSGTGVKKVSPRSPCRVRTELMLSELYADMLEIKFGTSSMRNVQRQAQVVADMHQQQFQSEIEIARIRGFGTLTADEDLSQADRERINDIRQDTEDFQESMQDGLDHGAFEVEEMADTVYARGAMIPNSDVPGAYCVVVVHYDREDPETREVEGRGVFARASYLGDLQKDAIVEFSVRVSMGEFNTETAEYALHVFGQDGEQVALSNSRGLKPLTPEQVRTFRELSEKTSRKDS